MASKKIKNKKSKKIFKKDCLPQALGKAYPSPD